MDDETIERWLVMPGAKVKRCHLRGATCKHGGQPNRELNSCAIKYCTRKSHKGCSESLLCSLHGPLMGSPKETIPLADTKLKSELVFVCEAGGLWKIADDVRCALECKVCKCTHICDEEKVGLRTRGEVEENLAANTISECRAKLAEWAEKIYEDQELNKSYFGRDVDEYTWVRPRCLGLAGMKKARKPHPKRVVQPSTPVSPKHKASKRPAPSSPQKASKKVKRAARPKQPSKRQVEEPVVVTPPQSPSEQEAAQSPATNENNEDEFENLEPQIAEDEISPEQVNARGEVPQVPESHEHAQEEDGRNTDGLRDDTHRHHQGEPGESQVNERIGGSETRGGEE